jgi:hypothetical protein
MKIVALIILGVTVAMLAGCETMQGGMTYLQSNTAFCSAGLEYLHNPDGTSSPIYMQNGKQQPCR